jgi:hypothetical protein
MEQALANMSLCMTRWITSQQWCHFKGSFFESRIGPAQKLLDEWSDEL